MSKHPDAVYCDEFAGDFVSFVKQATPLGYFKAINNRMVDGGEVGSVDETIALGSDFPYGIWANTYDPVDVGRAEPAGRAKSPSTRRWRRRWAPNTARAGRSWATSIIAAIAEGIEKAGSTDEAKVAKAMAGMTYQTPLGPRTFNATTHEADPGEYLGRDGEGRPNVPFAVIKNPTYYNPEPADRS